MSGKGNGCDKAMVETFSEKPEAERVRHAAFQSRARATDTIDRPVDAFRNPVRRRSTSNFIRPLQFDGPAG